MSPMPDRATLTRTFLLLATAASVLACDDDQSSPAPALPTSPVKAAEGFVEISRAAGLRFKMQFLPGEQGEKFKINLYDHGSGVAVADIDGDGFDDVYFLNQLGSNGLFRNDGTGKFADITKTAGVGLGDRVCLAAAFGDVEGDGDQDLYVTSVRGGNVFFRNDGTGKFIDATMDAGLKLVAHSESAAFFDYDGDGDLDLFVTNTAKWTSEKRDREGRYFEGADGLYQLAESPVERNVLYRNDGKGAFTDVTAQAGVAGPGWGGDMAVVDFDADGRSDLFVGNMFGSSTLYRNEGDGTFKDITRAALGRTSWGAVGVKAFDYDDDGRVDLMLADMHSDMWMYVGASPPDIDEQKKYAGVEGPMVERGLMTEATAREIVAKCAIRTDEVVFGNTLFRNLGGGKFEEVSDKVGAETFWPWGVANADFDMDGDQDMFLPSGMGYPLFYWRNYLLMNRGDGTFEDRSRDFGIDPPPGGIYLEELVGGRLAPRSSRSAAVGDFDSDGRPDLVVGNFNDHASLFHNVFPPRRWVALRLTGTRSNRDAIGALATIRVAGRAQHRQVDAASGYLAQSTKTLYFGLGDAAAIESCEIRWPSGTVQKLEGLRLNAVNSVTEPTAR